MASSKQSQSKFSGIALIAAFSALFFKLKAKVEHKFTYSIICEIEIKDSFFFCLLQIIVHAAFRLKGGLEGGTCTQQIHVR